MLDKWLAVARHAPSTAYDTKSRLDRHVRPALGAQKVAAVTTELLDGFYLDLEQNGAAPASIRRIHGMLRAAFGQAVRWDWIDRNPAQGCRLPEVPNPTGGDVARHAASAARCCPVRLRHLPAARRRDGYAARRSVRLATF